MKVTDLTGKKFGNWTVLERAPRPEGLRHPSAFWLCRCDCGTVRVVRSSHLTDNMSVSCGCMKGALISKALTTRYADRYVGRRFNKLVVLKEADKQNNWECACDCGGSVVLPTRSLQIGHCGCLHHNKLDIAASGYSQTPEYQTLRDMIRRCEDPSNISFPYYGAKGIKVCPQWRHDFLTFLADMGRRPSEYHSIDRIDNNGDYTPENCRWSLKSEQIRNRNNTIVVKFEGKDRLLCDLTEERNLNYHTVYSRIYRSHWSVEKALAPAVDDAREELRRKSKESGVPYHTVKQRIKQLGWSEEQALATPIFSARKLRWNDVEYTYKEWEYITGISQMTIMHRVEQFGWSAEKALTTPAEDFKQSRSDYAHIIIGDKDQSLSKWCKERKLGYATARYRLSKGEPPEVALGFISYSDWQKNNNDSKI